MGLVREEWLTDIREQRSALDHIIEGARLVHGEPMQAYLIYMGIRLVEMHRVLRETGSIYLHCDPTTSHYLKAAMDAIFGHRNFLAEIVWHYGHRGPTSRAKPANAHDVLLVYAKSYGKHTYNIQHVEYSERYVKGQHEYVGVPLSNVWGDLKYNMVQRRQESVGYPTQKPRVLLDRIISVSSNPGDVVLDPFCGCATACVAAEAMTTFKLGGDSPPMKAPRLWIGVDIRPEAHEIVLQRMKAELGIQASRVQHKTINYEREDVEGNLYRVSSGDLPERTDQKTTLPRTV